MDVHSTSGEDDIASSVYRRKKRTKHLPQRTQNDTDSEDEKILDTSAKSRVRNRKFAFKESDNSESDNQTVKVSTGDVECSLNHVRTTKSPATIPEGNQFEATSPEANLSKRKTRNSINQDKITSLQENDEGGFKMDTLLSKHSDLFDCESDNDDMADAPIEEQHEEHKASKQKKESKTPRLSKKEKFKLHSEAQRAVRESNICLPKYQPKVKPIDDFLKKLKNRSMNNIKPTLSIKRGSGSVQVDEPPTSKIVLDGSNSNSAALPVVGCQDESNAVLSTRLQAETAAVAQNEEKASQHVMPATSHSMSQKDTLPYNQDSVSLELENPELSQSGTASKTVNTKIMKAIKDVPAPKLCSHTEWEETNIVSPVEELQNRLVKHASIISPEVVEDSALTRDEWKSILYKQVSERRASERRAVEEITKLDNEEFSPMESEAELTDEESHCEKEESEKVMDGEDEASKEKIRENDFDAEESHLGWQSDSNCFSDDDNAEDGDSEDNEENSDDDNDDDDDELIVKTKKTAKQLESDSDSEMPSTDKPITPVIRHFPFDKETSTVTNQTSDLNNTMVTEERVLCEDGDKKVIDSGLGTSLLVGASSDVDNSTIESNSSKVDNVTTLIETTTPKRPSEDDTILTTESNSLLSTELDRSSISASNSICQYDEETQFLDSNGFLNVKQKSKHTPVPALDDSAVPSQLIQLCSGQFSTKNASNSKLLSKKPVDLDQSSLLQRRDSKDLPTTQGVRELLGFKEPTNNKPLSKSISSVLLESSHCDDNSQLLALCSGNFSSQFTSFSKTKQETSDGVTDEDDSSSDNGEELMMLTNGRHLVTNTNQTPNVGTNNFDDGSDDDEMLRLNKRRSRKYFKNKERSIKRRRLEEFVESEAELSGSDHGLPSDEEQAYLDNEEDEMLERWSGDSDVNVSEDELKKQVNRVHMKYTLADDSANLKDIKERFLPGGDLYEDGIMLKDGYFRKRKFAHVGSETSLDLFADDRVLDSGDEQFNDESSQAEAMRRKQRLEKEEFLSQMRQHDSLLDDENSQQLLKMVKQSSIKISATATLNKQRPTTVQLHSTKTLKRSCGSFLKRNKDELSKLSSSVTSTTVVNLSSSKNFVFQTGTTPTVTTSSDKTTPQVKRSHSVKNKTKSPKNTLYKRSRSLPQDENSIFNILN